MYTWGFYFKSPNSRHAADPYLLTSSTGARKNYLGYFMVNENKSTYGGREKRKSKISVR